MASKDKTARLRLAEAREATASQSVVDYLIRRIDDLALQAMDAIAVFMTALSERDPDEGLYLDPRMSSCWNASQFCSEICTCS